MRLIALPYAGRGASAFGHFASFVPEGIELLAVQFPGREDRLAEPRFTSIDPLVAAVAEAFVRDLLHAEPLPYVLFGHSLGGLVAFELTRDLRRRGATLPIEVLISGRLPPDHDAPPLGLHRLPEDAFRRSMRELAGTPEEVLRNEDLMGILSPILRDDLEICETYVFRPEAPLEVPLTVYGGIDDASVPTEILPGWARQSRKECTVRPVQGTHWFVNSDGSKGERAFAKLFREDLVRCLARSRGGPPARPGWES
ncbi:MAG: thioesterase [Candidatus Latescibacteria bacterium]|nr:thioesterase [Candidatus Latescibacterota bacterium]